MKIIEGPTVLELAAAQRKESIKKITEQCQPQLEEHLYPNITPADYKTRGELLAALSIMKSDYLEACKCVAEMHAAALGVKGEGPRRGVVEDVEDLRLENEKLKQQLVRLERETLLHAACLSIAEGAPDWDKPNPYGMEDSAATLAVRELRRRLLCALGGDMAEPIRGKMVITSMLDEIAGFPRDPK